MTNATATDLTVANTIRDQLGGNRFTAMTGAKMFVGDTNSLSFQIGRAPVMVSAGALWAPDEEQFRLIGGSGALLDVVKEGDVSWPLFAMWREKNTRKRHTAGIDRVRVLIKWLWMMPANSETASERVRREHAAGDCRGEPHTRGRLTLLCYCWPVLVEYRPDLPLHCHAQIIAAKILAATTP